MENRKEKLISGLRTVINALKNDTIFYDWSKQESCNCGVVAQAVLGQTRERVESQFNEVVAELQKLGTKDNKINLTWRNGVKYLCPITGLSNIQIFDNLAENGLTKEDMVHLEYMNNPAILKKSGIKLYDEYERQEEYIKESIQKTREVPHPRFWYRLFGYKVTESYNEHVMGYRTVKDRIEVKGFFKEKENLIKYLQAWVDILTEGSQKKSIQAYDADELEAEILIAVAEENYEGAALLRDRLTEMA